ncbi:MAG: oxidoreductase C-terminal domain-containing protein, partial [Vitreimonas sp.]
VDNGVLVDGRMQTSAAGVFAAGDVARYPDARSGEPIRVEHWVAAERQGQAAAMSMLGDGAAFAETPFFWSQHYEHRIRYVGRAASWDRVDVDGAIDAGDFTVRYFGGARLLAAASLGRDGEALAVHEEMNREAQAALT